jgi:serine/threonine protein kinase
MYKKGRFIGGGGFGKVYVATNPRNESFALKELALDNYQHDTNLMMNITRRFKQEAMTQAEIEHENVIKVYHQQLDANPPYFVMELAQCTFEEVIGQFFAGQASFDLVKSALFDILSGLGALHEIGIWHRDLKPQNVLFVPPNKFAISDFGLIAVRDGQGTTLTMTGTTAGSREYSPPEFMRDFKLADASSDFYAFGSILHDIFVRKPRVPYSELKDGTGKIGEVIAKCTRSRQYQRYRSVEELRADLYDALAEFGSGAVPAIANASLGIFNAETLNEADCDSIIEMIEAAGSTALFEIYRAFSIDFVDRVYLASNAAANYMAGQFAKYVIDNSFDFEYCDVLADKLVHFLQRGDIATKAICLLALLELGASHNRWYVENRFVKWAGPDCPATVVKRMLLDAKTNNVNLMFRLTHLFGSISVRVSDLHPQIAAHVPQDVAR